MNYKKALLAKAFNKPKNVDFIMVAPQELRETSCGPKSTKFTIIRRVKARKSNFQHAIVKTIGDEYIPHVRKFTKLMQVYNYAPTSLYTARNIARSQQSHKFVKKCETKKN